MIDEVFALENMTFLKTLRYVLKGFKLLHIVMLILALGLFALDGAVDFFYLFTLLFVYVVGILLSIAIHEYAHLWSIKKLTTHKQVRIVIMKATFSIRPLVKIKGIKSIIIAFAGPLPCILIGILLFLVRAHWREHDTVLLLLGISYGIHILSFWPFSGDGLMIISGLIDLSKGGDNND